MWERSVGQVDCKNVVGLGCLRYLNEDAGIRDSIVKDSVVNVVFACLRVVRTDLWRRIRRTFGRSIFLRRAINLFKYLLFSISGAKKTPEFLFYTISVTHPY